MNDKRGKYEIYIWRFDRDGNIKPAFCCNRCTMIVKKYNYNEKIYTFYNNDSICSIVDNPKVSLGYKLNEWGIK